MRLEEHMEESIRLFGKPYEEVHRWLDEFARSEEYGMRHRKVRHHLEGLRQVEQLFGKEAVPVGGTPTFSQPDANLLIES